ncbi:hypothetical protein [Streptomyces sp. NPDC058683]|uniref:hypothetical protein n=1 Tax=Streptomyces sp. NPDC058683 TaxID=3346597 RepID=UPI00365FD266
MKSAVLPSRPSPGHTATPDNSPTRNGRNAPSDSPESLLQHPDFELYDNVGRTSEQIRAHHTGSATTDDLHRWAERDAADFRAAHALPTAPFPVPDLSPYREALDAADTPAEFSTVLNALLDAVEPFLGEVIDHLALTARWKNQNRGAQTGSPPKLLRDAASRISSALAMAAEADLQILRAHYDPPPDPDSLAQRARTARGTPPGPPPPSPPPAPGGPSR